MRTPYDPVSVLLELEPEVGRLYDRHAAVAREWFPHDYIPYRLGRDFDREPWTPDQPRLTGVAQTAFEVGLLTEDNLPSYHRLIHSMFREGDGAWMSWIGRWTAEEGRHAIVLRDYLTVTRNLDPVLLERARMAQVGRGYDRLPLQPPLERFQKCAAHAANTLSRAGARGAQRVAKSSRNRRINCKGE